MGTGGFFTTQNLSRTMRNTATAYYDTYNFKNYELVSSLGIVEDDLKQIESVDNVTDVEGVIVLDGYIQTDNDKVGVILRSLTERVSVPNLTQGRLPKQKNECLIVNDLKNKTGLNVDDEIIVSAAFNNEEALIESKFRIVGICDDPDYMRKNYEMIVIVDQSAFNTDVTKNMYNRAFVTVNNVSSAGIFEDKYLEDNKTTKDELLDLTRTLKFASIKRVQDTANEEIDKIKADAMLQIEDGQKQIEEGEKTLKVELAKAQQQIADGQSQLDSALAQLNAGEKELSNGKRQLEEAKRILNNIESIINKYHISYDAFARILKEIKVIANPLVNFLESEQNQKVINAKLREYIYNLVDKIDTHGINNASELAERIINKIDFTVLGDELEAFSDLIIKMGIEDKIEELPDLDPDEMKEFVEYFIRTLSIAKDLMRVPESQQIARENIKAELIRLIDKYGIRYDVDPDNIDAMIDELDISGICNDLADEIEILLEQFTIEEIEEILSKIITDEEELQLILSLINQSPYILRNELFQQMISSSIKQQIREFLEREDISKYTSSEKLAEAIVNSINFEKVADYIEVIVNYAVEHKFSEIARMIGVTETRIKTMLLDFVTQIKLYPALIKNPWIQEMIKSSIRSYAKKYIDEYGLDNISIDKLKEYIKYIDFRIDLSPVKNLLSKIDQLTNLKDQIRNGEAQIAYGEKELQRGWNKYYEGVAQLEDAKKQYEQGRIDGNKKIEESKKLLEERKQELEDEIAKARKEFDNLKCEWIIQDRGTNFSYLNISSNIRGIEKSGIVFGVLFLLISGIVAFSTMAIIVDEEKKYVGTTKAFGFRNMEILAKYLSFGVLSVIFGVLFGYGFGHFMSDYVLKVMDRNQFYTYGLPNVDHDTNTMTIVGIVAVILSVVVTVGACMGLLKSPASSLMKGEIKGKKKNKKEEKSSEGSLYSRLIVRNMISDLPRVLVSIAVIAGSVFLIGLGISIRDSFNNMSIRQLEDIYKYDVRISSNSELTKQQKAEVEKVLDNLDVDYLPVYYGSNLYESNGNFDGALLIVADPDRINDFISLNDPKTKKPVELPENGVLVQNTMFKYNKVAMNKPINLYDSSLNKNSVEVVGQFNNHIGRLFYMTENAYRNVFDEKVEYNSYLVICDDSQIKVLQSNLDRVSNEIILEKASSLVDSFKAISSTYDVVLGAMLAISTIMSFLILSNLANILLSKKKKELIVMRINGFSIGKTIKYLASETVVTTLIGIVVGLILGGLLASYIINFLGDLDIQFVQDYNVKAWVVAFVLESIFATIIYGVVFSRVRKLNFREVA